jgi:UDP-glucose 4-epimerase
MSKHILLTGANGFIGRYFKRNYSDNYKITTFSFRNDTIKYLNLNDTDVVMHLSALVHQMAGASSEEYERVNVSQTLELAKKAKASGVRHFVFMSTIAVYGIETGVINEHTHCDPITDYGKSKLRAEVELQKLEDDNFKVSIIRPPIVNGYDAPGNMKSLISLVKKIPVLPFGNIQNRRSMVYVGSLCFFMDAVVRFPVKLRMTGNELGMTGNELRMTGSELGMTGNELGMTGSVLRMTGDNIFLVADDRSVSTTELIELIAKALGKKVYLIQVPFFESLLKLVKPSFHKRLFESLEVDNTRTMRELFGEVKTSLPVERSDKTELSLPYSIEDGIRFMIRGE